MSSVQPWVVELIMEPSTVVEPTLWLLVVILFQINLDNKILHSLDAFVPDNEFF